MKYRQFRKLDTGQWLDVLFTVQAKNGLPDVFSVPELSHRTDIARALGLLPAVLEVVDADSDIRVGPFISFPIPAPTPPTAAELAQAQAISDAAALVTNTVAELFAVRFPLQPLSTTEKNELTLRQKNLIAKAQGR